MRGGAGQCQQDHPGDVLQRGAQAAVRSPGVCGEAGTGHLTVQNITQLNDILVSRL